LPWIILALRHPETSTMFEMADRPFGGKPFQSTDKQARTRMIEHLRIATDLNFGYDANGRPEEIELAISAWENWWAEHTDDYAAASR